MKDQKQEALYAIEEAIRFIEALDEEIIQDSLWIGELKCLEEDEVFAYEYGIPE
jgi:hypothetical protein